MEVIAKGGEMVGGLIDDLIAGFSGGLSSTKAITDYKNRSSATKTVNGKLMKLDGKFHFDPQGTVGHIAATGQPINEAGEIIQHTPIMGITNSYLIHDAMVNIDKATDKIIDPRRGLIKKNNRFAGSIKSLKTNLYSNQTFMNNYLNLITTELGVSPTTLSKMSDENILNLFKNNPEARTKLIKLINDNSKFDMKDKTKTKEDEDEDEDEPRKRAPDDAPIMEIPIGGGPSNPNPAIPTTVIPTTTPLWSPEVRLGGQDILKLNDIDKLEELKNFTLFDLVSPLLIGDPENLLSIQNEIKNSIRFYNNYAPPKPPPELPEAPDTRLYGRPMMNQHPVQYPFRLDNTGNQQASKYYSTFSDQDRTELKNDYDVIKRSNLEPDVIQLVNRNEVSKTSFQEISDIDLFFMRR